MTSAKHSTTRCRARTSRLGDAYSKSSACKRRSSKPCRPITRNTRTKRQSLTLCRLPTPFPAGGPPPPPPPGGGEVAGGGAARAAAGGPPRAPGGDSVEQYIKRLADIEGIANSFPGVEKSYAISAGREVRVFVKPEGITDFQARELARNIALRIENELKYPGEIKVLVIRETRAIEFAR